MRATYINPRSGATWPADRALWRAPDDGGLLELAPGKGFARDEIERSEPSLWRYRAAIRVEDKGRVSLGEGFTPLVETNWDGRRLLFKCEHLMPTGSFKDRGTTVMMSHLKQAGIEALLEDSSGNAGASIAAYAAAAGIRARIMVPDSAPAAKRVQIAAAGAELQEVAGDRDAVERAALVAAETMFYASHNRQPFFLEGTKTLAFELWEQLGFRAPAAVAAPCGNGANILGLYLGFRELQEAGQIDALPRLHAVQAANNSPIRALMDGRSLPQGPTVADGIATARPIRGQMVAEVVRATGGSVPVASEDAIMEAVGRLARSGWFLEPTSAVVVAALPQIPEEDLVLVLTGSGLKALGVHACLAEAVSSNDSGNVAAPAFEKMDIMCEKPPWVKPKLRAAPRIREVYWCEFPKDAQLPEVWKTRPVIVFSRNSQLRGQVTVIPTTTDPQDENKMSVRITSPISGKAAWAICSHITTVATSRLSLDRKRKLRLSYEEFQQVVETVFRNLPDRREP